MFRRILVPLDGSPPSNRALGEAISLAKDQAGRLCLLHVVDELMVMPAFDGAMYVPASYMDEFMKAMRDQGRKLLANAEAAARRHHVKADTVLLETLGHRVAELIIKQARKWRADVIVLGTHGRRRVSRMFDGQRRRDGRARVACARASRALASRATQSSQATPLTRRS
jgi:nucleotide-binding universal stress UspA family protein